MTKILYQNDKDCRKGCHPVMLIENSGTKNETRTLIFSVDEPGAWWDDKWNCHVDGTDYPFDTLEQCITWGLYVHGYLEYQE